jgi:hypothetical protein
MFTKKYCKNCNRKLNSEFDFCPYCGTPVNQKKAKSQDWGMLGKDDSLNNEIRLPPAFGSLFNSLVKSLEKQFMENMNEVNKGGKKELPKRSGISISISSTPGNSPKVKVNSFGKTDQKIKKRVVKTSKFFTQEQLEKFSNLPREEPKTSTRRFANTLIYELEMPGLTSMEDISITRLESSMEIRGLGKEKAYFKIVPVNFPIARAYISEGKVILEFAVKE